jgi:N-methylhydantoinase B
VKATSADDPISLEVIKNAFISTADEMAAVLGRTAYSLNVRERMDFSCCLLDQEGNAVSQSARIPLHLNSIGPFVKNILKYFPQNEIEPGDVFVANDPYFGGQHLPDVLICNAIFCENRLSGFSANLAHHVDIGGSTAGSLSNSATEIFQEGLRIPPAKLYEGGRENRGVTDLIRTNVRTPELFLGDIRAQLASVRLGERRLQELFAKYGREVVLRSMDHLITYSERRMRQSLEEIPDGEYIGEDRLDPDVISGKTAIVQVAVKVNGSDIYLDFSASSPQQRATVNSSLSATCSAAFYAIRTLADPDIMQNEGCYRMIHITAPEGTIVNPHPPAACNARTIVCHRIVDAIYGALMEVVPQKVVAPSYGCPPNQVLSGIDPRTGHYFLFFDGNHASWGARYDKDGNDGLTSNVSNGGNTPIEACEIRYPVRFQAYEFVTDSGGPGKFRGGLAINRQIKVLAERACLTMLADREVFPPVGYMGGRPAKGAKAVLYPHMGKEKVVSIKSTNISLGKGASWSFMAAGGGGFGDPLERNPERVKWDVLEGKVSLEAAREEYGVVIDPQNYQVNEAATAALRVTLRRKCTVTGRQ